MIQKSYDGTEIVYVVPTPIGNMEDMTIRAINVLKSSDVIFSEDTRETLTLLNYYGIEKKILISSHKFNENNNSKKLLNYLKEGKKVSIVSDRGTPGISDPGFSLIKILIEENYNVVCLPGATAFVPALIMSSFSPDKFMFYGFLNSKKSKAIEELKQIKGVNVPIIFYEAPHRLTETLQIIYEVFGNRKASLAREISKKYEEIIRDDLENLNSYLPLKGEIVIIVDGNKEIADYSDIEIKKHVDIFIEDGYTSKEAIKEVAKLRKVPKSVIYSEYHKK